jgi:cystine transport system permease protein
MTEWHLLAGSPPANAVASAPSAVDGTGAGWDLFWSSLWPLVSGAVTGTIPLALISFVLGLVIALFVALMRLSRNRVVSGIARGYISVIRGTPLLVQLFIIFYGLPSIGLTIDPWPSAIIAFSLNVGGYAAEVIRAAILSVHKGQWEAAYTIGMSRARALRRIILPQAARVSVPPLSNTFISLVKDTSLASVILVTEMFRVAQRIAAFSQEFMLVYIEAALIYWVICLVLSSGQGVLEKRLDRYVAH